MLAVEREAVPMDERGEKLERRVTVVEIGLGRIEAHLAHIATDVTELKATVREMARDQDLRELRAEMSKLAKEEDLRELRAEVGLLRDSLASAKIWALLIAASILGVLARGFHWI
jgi:chromosome segregation ATPase